MTYRKIKSYFCWIVRYLCKFEDENAEAFEFMKWRGAQGIGLLVAIESGISVIKPDFEFLAQYAVGIFIAAVILVVFWLMEAFRNRITFPDVD